MVKKYSVKELATILGCSVTAVNKKIKTDPDNPDIKRYRNRYKTVVENNTTYILLDDEALEEEKNKSKGFKTGFSNVYKTGYNNIETEDYIDVEPISQTSSQDRIFEFTERYINDITTLQKTFYNEMRQKDQQILLLTTSENQKQAEYLETQALNKQLKKQNNILTLVLAVVITLLLTFIILFTLAKLPKNETPEMEQVPEVQNVQPQPVQNVQKYKPIQRSYNY